MKKKTDYIKIPELTASLSTPTYQSLEDASKLYCLEL